MSSDESPKFGDFATSHSTMQINLEQFPISHSQLGALELNDSDFEDEEHFASSSSSSDDGNTAKKTKRHSAEKIIDVVEKKSHNKAGPVLPPKKKFELGKKRLTTGAPKLNQPDLNPKGSFVIKNARKSLRSTPETKKHLAALLEKDDQVTSQTSNDNCKITEREEIINTDNSELDFEDDYASSGSNVEEGAHNAGNASTSDDDLEAGCEKLIYSEGFHNATREDLSTLDLSENASANAVMQLQKLAPPRVVSKRNANFDAGLFDKNKYNLFTPITEVFLDETMTRKVLQIFISGEEIATKPLEKIQALKPHLENLKKPVPAAVKVLMKNPNRALYLKPVNSPFYFLCIDSVEMGFVLEPVFEFHPENLEELEGLNGTEATNEVVELINDSFDNSDANKILEMLGTPEDEDIELLSLCVKCLAQEYAGLFHGKLADSSFLTDAPDLTFSMRKREEKSKTNRTSRFDGSPRATRNTVREEPRVSEKIRPVTERNKKFNEELQESTTFIDEDDDMALITKGARRSETRKSNRVTTTTPPSTAAGADTAGPGATAAPARKGTTSVVLLSSSSDEGPKKTKTKQKSDKFSKVLAAKPKLPAQDPALLTVSQKIRLNQERSRDLAMKRAGTAGTNFIGAGGAPSSGGSTGITPISTPPISTPTSSPGGGGGGGNNRKKNYVGQQAEILPKKKINKGEQSEKLPLLRRNRKKMKSDDRPMMLEKALNSASPSMSPSCSSEEDEESPALENHCDKKEDETIPPPPKTQTLDVAMKKSPKRDNATA